MSLEDTESPVLDDSPQAETVTTRPRKQSAESIAVRHRREAIAIDGLMFESGSGQEESSSIPLQQNSGPDNEASGRGMDARGQNDLSDCGSEPSSLPSKDKNGDGVLEIATSNLDKVASTTMRNGSPQKTSPAPLSSTSSASSASSPSTTTTSPGSPPESPAEDREISSQLQEPGHGADLTSSALQGNLSPPTIVRSLSHSKRQSVFLADHITVSQEGPLIDSPSTHLSGSNDDSQDMKEVEIETTDPSHLFWVPFHLHPEIAPNEYNQWLTKHGVESETADGIISSRKASVTRRKSVLSAQYNPEEDQEDRPSRPARLEEEAAGQDFLSGVFSVPLEQMGEPPLKTKTSLRRSVSLSVSSPTRDHFPADAVEEDLISVKRTGGLERGGLSLLRRSARTKLRRNSSASNDTRTDVSRLRQITNANGEYPAVSLVDPGPQPLPSASQSSTTTPTSFDTASKGRRDGDVPLKRFVSTLRDSSKPTITTYVEPHLLEQQRKENEEAQREEDGTPSFRVSAPAKLENSAAARLLVEAIEDDRQEMPDNFTVNYPIPPPVKLTKNLLQQPVSQQPPSSQIPQSPVKQKQVGQPGTPSHAKKPSTWSWLWGKEKGSEKSTDLSSAGLNAAGLPQVSNIESNTSMSSPMETTVKKQSTLSMLFSRNGKSTSSKAQATTAETTHSATINGVSGQSVSSERPKYSNYNRLPIHIERAIYRLSHVKLANPRRPLHEQVLISNMMFWYLGVIQQQQQLQQQQQVELQKQQHQQAWQQQQKQGGKGSDSREDGKESKSKLKPKKRKSQKKKSRGSPKPAERLVKSPEYEKQQQQYHGNLADNHITRPRQPGASLALGNHLQDGANYYGEPDEESRISGNGKDVSDSYEESEGEESLSYQQQQQNLKIGSQSDTLKTLSIQPALNNAQEDEEDDNVPLAHYQNMPRQTIPVS